MSGSRGGPPIWIGSGGQSTECDKLRFKTNLASPVEEVVKLLVVGVELEVSLEAEGVQRVVTRYEADEAGSIVERLSDLIRCLQMGNTFSAVVQEIDDGIVRVEVQPT